MTVGQGSFTAVVFHKDRDGSLQISSLCPDFTAKERKAQRREVLCPKPHSYRVAEFKPESRILPSQLRLCLSTSRKPPNNSLFFLNLFMFGCAGSLLWLLAFSGCGQEWLLSKCILLLRSTGSRCVGFSSCGTWHVGSFPTKD